MRHWSPWSRPPMQASVLIVRGIGGGDTVPSPLVNEQRKVQALTARRPHPSPGVGARDRCLAWRAHRRPPPSGVLGRGFLRRVRRQPVRRHVTPTWHQCRRRGRPRPNWSAHHPSLAAPRRYLAVGTGYRGKSPVPLIGGSAASTIAATPAARHRMLLRTMASILRHDGRGSHASATVSKVGSSPPCQQPASLGRGVAWGCIADGKVTGRGGSSPQFGICRALGW